MKVAIEMRTVAPRSPGQQRYLWRMGVWLAETGHDVHVLLAYRVQPGSGDAPNPAPDHPLTVHPLAGASPDQIRRRVDDLAPDVLLLNPERSHPYRGLRPNVVRTGYGTDQYVQKLRSLGGAGERRLRTLLRRAPWVRARRDAERAFYGRPGDAPEVIAQSAYIAGEIARTYPHVEGHVHVVHNGVDLTEFNPETRRAGRDAARTRFGIPHDAQCLLVLGHNFRLKGLREVVRALDSWPVADVPWLLVAGKGTGPLQRRWARAVAGRSRAADRVRFAGPVDSSLEAHAAADALAHLSWHDSFGFVVLEAMATGLPVVSSVWAGASELIDDGRTGWVVDPADTSATTRALRSALGPEGEPAGMAAYESARAFDEPGRFARIEAVLRRASEGGRSLRGSAD